MPSIHPTALIGSDCLIHESVVIEAFAVIEDNVIIGPNTTIGAHSVIGAFPKTKGIGRGNKGVKIGENVTISQGCIVDRGILKPTEIESEVYILPQVYIGHDSTLQKGVVVSSGCNIGGYVCIGEFSNLGLGVSVHQFSTIGAYTMIGMNAVVSRDIPPLMKAFGNPIRIHGVNTKGIERLQMDENEKNMLLGFAETIILQKKWMVSEIKCCLDFLTNSKRPIAKFDDK